MANGKLIAGGIVLLGIGLRAQLFLLDRALWRDESMLAIGVRDSTWAQLLEPLPFSQKAPLLYLFIQKASLNLLGPAEWSLRLFPFVASLFSLLLFAWVLRRTLGLAGQIVGLLALATSDWGIRYSAEAKPYGVDLALAVGVLATVVRVTAPSWKSTHLRLLGLGLFGAIGTALSFPGIFLFAAASLAMLFHRPPDAASRRRSAAVALGAGAAISAAGLYFGLYRRLTSDPFLLDYFQSSFAPLPWPISNLTWYPRKANEFFLAPGGMVLTAGAGPLVTIVGLFLALRQPSRAVALFPVLAAICTVAASMLLNYPLVGRLVLFMVPLVIWAMALACDPPARTRFAMAWSVAAATFVLIPGVLLAARGVIQPTVLEDPRALLRQLQREVRPGDVLYLHEFAVPALHWYSPELAAPGAGLRIVNAPFGDLRYYDKAVLRERVGRQLAGFPRVWLIDGEERFSHRWLLAELGTPRAEQPEIASLNFRAVLYDTRTPPTR